MIRPLNVKDKADNRLLNSLRRLANTQEWKEFQSFLETELHRIDVANRVAEPYQATRLGASAETLQAVIHKVAMAGNILNPK